MKISVKPNRKKQIYCYFFALPPNPPFHILNKNAECFTAETMDNIMVSMWYIAIKCAVFEDRAKYLGHFICVY